MLALFDAEVDGGVDEHDEELNVASDHVDGPKLALYAQDALLPGFEIRRRQKVVTRADSASMAEAHICHKRQVDAADDEDTHLRGSLACLSGL